MSGQTYYWGNVRRSAFKIERWSWSLRWWLFVAFLLAVGLHIWLYELFNNLEVGKRFLPEVAKVKERPARMQLDPEILKKQEAIREIPDVIAPPQPQVKADLADVAEMLPDNASLDLTPSVNKVTNFLAPDMPKAGQPAAAPSLAAIADMTPGPDLVSSATALKSSTLSKAVSANQLTIPTKAIDKEIEGLDGKLLDRLNKAQSAGNGRPNLPGYSNLDDLIASGSPVKAGTAIAIPTDLLFDYGSDQLAEAARLSMMQLGFLIQKNPNSVFIIEGHTDNFGSEQFNRDLSQRRANAVVAWLQNSLRLGSDRIQAVGMGKSRLLVPDGNIVEQSPNRRVEIKVRPLRQ
jgi:outer membrane protein OmpA-like peptidoglycan-associated protein